MRTAFSIMKYFKLIILISIFFTGSIHANEFYLQSKSFYDSEPVPYLDFEKDWSSNYSPGDTGISYLYYETGVIHKRWGFGFFKKNQTYMKFKTDTALAVYTIASKQPIDNESYEIELNVKHYQVSGFHLFNTVVDKKFFQVKLGVSLLYGEKLIDGTLRGNLTALSESDYQFDNIKLDYYYSKDELFEHEASKPKGQGFAFDSEIFWQPKEQIQVHFIAKDLGARIFWKNAPVTVAVIESDNKTYDENGYVKVNATLQGNQATKDFTQHLAPYLALKTAFALYRDIELLFDAEYFYLKTFKQLGVGKKLPLNLTADLTYEFETGSAGLRVKHKNLELQVLSDHYQQSKAHVLGIVLNAAYEF